MPDLAGVDGSPEAGEDGDELIPWGSIRYLVGQAMYGGRVSDGWDRRGLVVYCEEFFGDFLFGSEVFLPRHAAPTISIA